MTHDQGARAALPVNGGQDALFSFSVNRGETIVEQEDVGSLDQGPRNADALFWPPLKFTPRSPNMVSKPRSKARMSSATPASSAAC